MMKTIGKFLELLPRAAWAVLFWSIVVVLTVLLATMLEFSFYPTAIVTVIAFGASVRPVMVSVPEVTALVTVNLLTGELFIHETGLHFRYLWEQEKVTNFINLRVIPFGSGPEGEDYPAKDGPKMHAKWQGAYRVVNAKKFIGVGREAVESLLLQTGSGVLSALITRNKAESVKARQAKVEEKLQQKFSEMKSEEICGVEILLVTLGDLDYDDAVQKVRSTAYVAGRIKQIAKDLRDGGRDNPDTMTAKESQNNVLLIDGKITKHINEVEGEGGNALAALLMAMAQGGNPTKDKK